jgi:hypothetical protein
MLFMDYTNKEYISCYYLVMAQKHTRENSEVSNENDMVLQNLKGVPIMRFW